MKFVTMNRDKIILIGNINSGGIIVRNVRIDVIKDLVLADFRVRDIHHTVIQSEYLGNT
jgi:hypothetical protein